MLRLRVEDSSRSFIPDKSYLRTTLEKSDEYFGETGISVELVTHGFDHFMYQDVLYEIQSKLSGYENKAPYIEGQCVSVCVISV